MRISTIDILTRAKALLTPPGAWCQRKTQIIEGGAVVSRDIVTAILNATESFGLGALSQPEFKAAYSAMWDATDGHGIIKYNDDPHTTQGGVMHAFDQALSIARRHSAAELIARRDREVIERRAPSRDFDVVSDAR